MWEKSAENCCDGHTDRDPNRHYHNVICPVWRRAYKKKQPVCSHLLWVITFRPLSDLDNIPNLCGPWPKVLWLPWSNMSYFQGQSHRANNQNLFGQQLSVIFNMGNSHNLCQSHEVVSDLEPRGYCKDQGDWEQEKKEESQSRDKNPYTHRTIQKATWQHKNATKNFDYTTIADRLRTVSWSNSSHPTGVVKPVYEHSTFPLTATAV